MVHPRISIEVKTQGGESKESLDELRRALTSRPRQIPSRYFYDRSGSELFARITRLPEYYLTRTEAHLLRRIADRLVAGTSASEVLELGSGAATKTRILLDAFYRAGILSRYVSFDVSESEIRRSAEELVATYPGLSVRGIVGDFMHHLEHLPNGQGQLVLFLGSTVGNLGHRGAEEFLVRLSTAMAKGSFLLLGVDLVKERSRLEAAYNDEAGVTAEFNRNILRVVNRRFGADFEPQAFRHRAFFDRGNEWIEMRLVSLRDQRVTVPALELAIELGEGEEIRTEISAKYRRERLLHTLSAAGLKPLEWFTDPDDLFALSLSRRES